MKQSPNDKRHAQLELEARQAQLRQAMRGRNSYRLSIAEALENLEVAERQALRSQTENMRFRNEHVGKLAPPFRAV
jgi:multidrug resistance efflux pump